MPAGQKIGVSSWLKCEQNNRGIGRAIGVRPQFSDLIMNILKFGGDVEVPEPPSLRQRVTEEAARMTALYSR